MVIADENKEKLDSNNANENKEDFSRKSYPKDSPGEVKSNKSPVIPGSNGKDAKENPYEFSDLSNRSSSQAPGAIDFILDIPLEVTIELVIELSKLAGESLEILANQRLIARGEVVVVNEKYGIRITEIISPTERIEGLK